MSARELLQAGTLSRIGDGSNVSIWGDRWIPKPTNFAVQSPCINLPMNAKVCDTEIVRDNFIEEEAEMICNLPLSRYRQQDKMIWFPTNTGEFSVRSAYHLEKEHMRSTQGKGSNSTRSRDLWAGIWKLQIPNAARMFLWRACSNILPTKDNLKRRRVVNDDLCFLCNRFVESVKHILWDCPSAQDVWGDSMQIFQKSQCEGDSFMEVMEYLLERCNFEELELAAIIARGI